MPIGALIALIVLLGGGGGASIAANSALPGDTLYPVKVGFNEKIAGAFQFSDSAKAAFESKLAETRLDEAAKLAAESKLSVDWKNKLEADFKTHADAAEKSMESVRTGGNAAATVTLASDLEAGLKTRHDILGQLKEADKIEVDSEINDVVKIREDASAQEKSDAGKSPEGAKNSAEGKIGAATNVVSSVKDALDKLSISSSTKADAQAKLSVAEGLLAQANAKFTAGDYSAAFDLAQQALRAAQEARVSGEVRGELDINIGDRPGRDDDSATSSRERGDGEGTSTGIKVEGNVNVKVGE